MSYSDDWSFGPAVEGVLHPVGSAVQWTTPQRANGSSTTFVGVVEKVGGSSRGVRLPGRKVLRWMRADQLTPATKGTP